MAITFSKESNDMIVNVLKDENGTTLKFSNEPVAVQMEPEPDVALQVEPEPVVALQVEPEPVVESPKSPEAMAWEAETDSDDDEDDEEYVPSKTKQPKAPSWTAAEDEILVNARKISRSWMTIAKKLPGRTNRACRAYYERKYGCDNELSKKKSKPPPPLPDMEPPKKKSKTSLTRVRWTNAEDEILLAGRKNWVNWQSKWTDIVLPGRTVSAMKCRWTELKRN